MSSDANPMLIYTDTSVIGGCLDDEFARDSACLFQLAQSGHLRVLISEIVLDELSTAPEPVRRVLGNLPTTAVTFVRINDEVIDLREAYLKAGTVGRRWRDDATHVAAATVANADAIVSWNFKHIVRLDLIDLYIGVMPTLDIRTL